MENGSAASTSVVSGRPLVGVPACVRTRADELLDLAVLRLLGLCLGVSAGIQGTALWIALLISPNLHYIPEIG